MQTANGRVEQELAEVAELSINGCSTGPVEVLICDGCDDTKGLVGTDLMRVYGMSINAQGEGVSIAECPQTSEAG